jgi:hypothetical protein
MCHNILNPRVKISSLLKLNNSYKFIFYFNIEIQNWWRHEMSLDEVHPPYCSSWKWFSIIIVHVFTIKMVWNGDWCGVDMWLTFSIGVLISTCTYWLPWFLVANNIFQLSLLFSTINYSWKGVGDVVGKRGFFSSECSWNTKPYFTPIWNWEVNVHKDHKKHCSIPFKINSNH